MSRRAGDFYGATLRVLASASVPFVVGGAFALRHYAGIHRETKDLDVFLRQTDVPRALRALGRAGYDTCVPFPHWLGKAYCGEHYVDVIFNSANGLCPVDEGWFASAVPSSLFGEPVLLCPIEEVIWTKAFVMERERFDGADVCHLIHAQGPAVDWRRLVARFGPHWRVLLGHLVFYTFAFPRDRDAVPRWVLDDLLARMEREREPEDVPVCRGTLVSREQYLIDVQGRGYEDARRAPWGSIGEHDLGLWTRAIGRRE